MESFQNAFVPAPTRRQQNENNNIRRTFAENQEAPKEKRKNKTVETKMKTLKHILEEKPPTISGVIEAVKEWLPEYPQVVIDGKRWICLTNILEDLKK